METLHPEFEYLKDESTEPEQAILYRSLSKFGPVPFELIAHINNKYWGELLTALSEAVAEEDPSMHFAVNLETKRMILRTTNLDLKKRATMGQITENPWWK